MHWTMACACGQTLRVHQEHLGRTLLCPGCEAPLVARAPRPAPTAAVRRRRWRWLVDGTLWLVAGTLAVVLVLVAGYGVVRGMRGSPQMGTQALSGSSPMSTMNMRFVSGKGPRGMRIPGAVASGALSPSAITPALRLPATISGVLVSPERPGNELRRAGQIAPFLGLAGDPALGLFLTAGTDGVVRCYSASLDLLGECTLSGVASQMVLDARRGRLYAAVSPPRKLYVGQLGDRDNSVGDLHVYDVNDLLQASPGERPRRPAQARVPLHTLALEAQINALVLSADGSQLCYLVESRQSHIGRLATESWTVEHTHHLSGGGPLLMSVAPDTGRLVGLARSTLFSLNPATWVLEHSLPLEGAFHGLAPVPDGRVYLLEKRGGSYHLVLLDLPRHKPIDRLELRMEGRLYLANGPGPGRLSLGSSAVLDGQIRVFDLAGATAKKPTEVGQVRRSRTRLLRGGLFLTPDGKYLLSGNGHVFHAPPRT